MEKQNQPIHRELERKHKHSNTIRFAFTLMTRLSPNQQQTTTDDCRVFESKCRDEWQAGCVCENALWANKANNDTVVSYRSRDSDSVCWLSSSVSRKVNVNKVITCKWVVLCFTRSASMRLLQCQQCLCGKILKRRCRNKSYLQGRSMPPNRITYRS